MVVDGSKMGCKPFNYPSLFVTCSVAKNRNAKGYSPNALPESPNALPESPEKSCAPTSIKMTNIDQKSELRSPDLSTVIENESQDIHAKDTAV